MDSIKKIKTIERYILDLKKDGFNVFLLESQYLVFEDTELYKKNNNQSLKESNTAQIGYGIASHSFSDLEHTYKIDLL